MIETLKAVTTDSHPGDGKLSCYHCGEDCPDADIRVDNKYFCCHGCLTVYQMLNQAGLCNYYELNPQSGINKREKTPNTKFAYLDASEVAEKLITFRDRNQAYTTFYIPAIHCSSCLYLLENLPALLKGVVRSDINFLKKEVSLVFNEDEVSLRQIADFLSEIGYEPYINHTQSGEKQAVKKDRSLIYRLGIAGFCFGNIMLFSIPEYFSGSAASEPYLRVIFRYLNVIFSLPVFFYSAAPFFTLAWKGIKQKYLNIDVPVALAIGATFIRSLVDVFFTDGSGFFDAMSGIVFFMLAGRVLQDRTQKALFFDRDYSDYFPMAAMVLTGEGTEKPTLLSDIKEGDRLIIRNNELIPADSMLIKGKCLIDYSFVSGESVPIEKKPGDLLYAGGRQLAGVAEMQVVKETSASKLTQLWSKELENEHEGKLDNKSSFVHALAQNFTLIVLAIATVSAIYWSMHDTSRIWPAVTAILIIACPCGLLLTSTFTNGYVMRILAKNGLFLRHPYFIERFGNIDHIVFDKTGTLTSTESMKAEFMGTPLSEEEKEILASVVRPSMHSFKTPVLELLGKTGKYEARNFTESAGAGVSATVKGSLYQLGIPAFFNVEKQESYNGTPILIYKDGEHFGTFLLTQQLRKGLPEMLKRLGKRISFSLISGDEPHQKKMLSEYFGEQAIFRSDPQEKLEYVANLRRQGLKVAMTGDGLNDAGALKKSDFGLCITDDVNRFTPAGDAIMDGSKIAQLDRLQNFSRKTKNTIRLCFGFSVLYNLTGLFFAVQGTLSPLIAAILMPLSTLTIIVTTYVSSLRKARKEGLII
ncbi:MAG: heavy metal translocating P-type ATPase metal-binding domain-containing protein [Chitinophagaceae bacterium]|nr:heavy metal translocating P-type ATPase metal-binding domain-containing protein [Chitinophagaceae bacterium]